MFEGMNVELANQHRNKIVKDADTYRQMRAQEDSSSALSKRSRGTRLTDLAGRFRNWLDMRVWKPVAGIFRPRISH